MVVLVVVVEVLVDVEVVVVELALLASPFAHAVVKTATASAALTPRSAVDPLMSRNSVADSCPQAGVSPDFARQLRSPTMTIARAETQLQNALDVLLSAELDPIVEVVLRSPQPNRYEALTGDGRVTFGRIGDAEGEPEFQIDVVEGRNPLGDQSVDRFAGLAAERDNRFPSRADNSYPFAFDTVAQLFDHPAAPDLCVVHAAAHNWEDQGGHRGEHGSLDVIQARAPFIIAGRGVAAEGMVDRGARLIDVAPTIAALLGEPIPGADGRVLTDVIDDATRPTHVVGFLFDGANPNVLYDLAERGDAPNVARLIAAGTAYRYGAMASLPTVTLANHTAILTGRHPGHHGILHNAWYDRALGQQVITNSPATWANSMQWLRPEAKTLHEVLGADGSLTVSCNEPCDRGAGWSTFDAMRDGTAGRAVLPESLPFATERFVRPSKDYRWSSKVDHLGMEAAVAAWRGEHGTLPRFTWANFTLTDAAFHEGGPHSEIAHAAVVDTDGRLGMILDAVEAAGAWDDTAFVLVADHGMEETNPEVPRGLGRRPARRRCHFPRRGLRLPLPRRDLTPTPQGAVEGCTTHLHSPL